MSSSRIFRSLGSRLILSFVFVILISMLVLAAIVPGIARSHQLALLEERLADEAQMVADYALTEMRQGHGGELDVVAKRLGQRTRSRITIIALDGTVLGESHQDLAQVGNHATRREVQAALATGRGVDLHRSETVGYDMLYVAVPIEREGIAIGTARAALPLSQVDNLIAELTKAILLAAIGGGLFAIVVALVAARAISRPLAALTRFAAAVSADPTQSNKAWLGHGPAEVALLGETLWAMAKTIRESLQRIGVERDRLDAVLDNLSDGVAIVNSDGRVTLLNKAAERVLDLRRQNPNGRTVAEALRDHELVELVEEVRISDLPRPLETRLLERTAPHRYLRAVASRFGAGEGRQTLLLLQDLTPLRRLETIRRDFVANVSHELRTPIAAIKAMAETLQDGAVDDPEAARDFLARIQQEVDGLHRMVEELLELSRLEAGRVEFVLRPVDARRLAESAVQRLAPMAERAEVALSVDARTDLPMVMADAERMGHVLVNLIHNAIKFTPKDGSIVVHVTPEEDRVRLSVVDTGIGIAAADLPRIFERFYKVDQARAGGGTGLGLAIAKHTVQLHSGRIWAESEGPGRGTTINVSLPLAANG